MASLSTSRTHLQHHPLLVPTGITYCQLSGAFSHRLLYRFIFKLLPLILRPEFASSIACGLLGSIIICSSCRPTVHHHVRLPAHRWEGGSHYSGQGHKPWAYINSLMIFFSANEKNSACKERNNTAQVMMTTVLQVSFLFFSSSSNFRALPLPSITQRRTHIRRIFCRKNEYHHHSFTLYE